MIPGAAPFACAAAGSQMTSSGLALIGDVRAEVKVGSARTTFLQVPSCGGVRRGERAPNAVASHRGRHAARRPLLHAARRFALLSGGSPAGRTATSFQVITAPREQARSAATETALAAVARNSWRVPVRRLLGVVGVGGRGRTREIRLTDPTGTLALQWASRVCVGLALAIRVMLVYGEAPRVCPEGIYPRDSRRSTGPAVLADMPARVRAT